MSFHCNSAPDVVSWDQGPNKGIPGLAERERDGGRDRQTDLEGQQGEEEVGGTERETRDRKQEERSRRGGVRALINC